MNGTDRVLPSVASPRLETRTAAFLLTTIVGVAAWLRLGSLGEQSLWWDEVVSWQQARLDIPDLIAATAADNYPPLQNLLIWASIRLLGETEFAMRLPSALLGIGNVLAICWLGALLAGRRVGLIAAALLALSGFHIWYSQEARMYALLACTATLFAGSGWKLAERFDWKWGVAATLAATALLYSHPYGALTWAAICGGLVVPMAMRRDIGGVIRFSALQLLPMLPFAPWALVLLGRAAVLDAEGFWIQPVTPWTVLQILVALLSGPLLFAAFGVACRLAAKRPIAPQVILLAFWVALPLAAGMVLSLLIEPMLQARYLIGILPAMLLLVAIGFDRLSGRSALIGMGALAVAALSGPFFDLGPRDDLRSVASVLAEEMGPNDCLVMTPAAANGLTYYYRAPLPCLVTAWNIAEAKVNPGTRTVFVRADAAIPEDALGLDAIGTVTSRRTFGVTRLLTLDPK